jgi:hypothetical protein
MKRSDEYCDRAGHEQAFEAMLFEMRDRARLAIRGWPMRTARTVLAVSSTAM